MSDSQKTNPVLVKNPNDGLYYDLSPLFSFMKQYDETFEGISGHLEEAAEMLPYLFKAEDWDTRDVEEALFEVRNLKKIFRKIKVVVD